MGVFDEFVDLAVELIEENGETSILSRRVDVVSTKPWRPDAPTVDNHPVLAVWIDEMTARKAGLLLKDGEAAVLIPAKGLQVIPDPATDTLVRASGSRHSVTQVLPVDPNGELIVYTLKVRA